MLAVARDTWALFFLEQQLGKLRERYLNQALAGKPPGPEFWHEGEEAIVRELRESFYTRTTGGAPGRGGARHKSVPTSGISRQPKKRRSSGNELSDVLSSLSISCAALRTLTWSHADGRNCRKPNVARDMQSKTKRLKALCRKL
jgi:hypothetical protein